MGKGHSERAYQQIYIHSIQNYYNLSTTSLQPLYKRRNPKCVHFSEVPLNNSNNDSITTTTITMTTTTTTMTTTTTNNTITRGKPKQFLEMCSSCYRPCLLLRVCGKFNIRIDNNCDELDLDVVKISVCTKTW